MADTQPAIFPFENRGLVTQTDASRLNPGEFAELKNLVSTQEGSLSTRRGRQLLTISGAFAGSNQSYIHTISKLTLNNSNDALNPRYVGALGELFRTRSGFGGLSVTGSPWTFDLASDIVADPAATYNQQRIGAVTYNAGAVGVPWIFFACQQRMLKDNGSLNSGDGLSGNTILQKWGILPPTRPASAVTGAAGTLVGIYNYVYVFTNTLTGAVSNPSVLMLTGVTATSQILTVTVGGTADPQITGAASIQIYRQGGTYADGLYRLVGHVTNPGAGATTTFSDNQSDVDLEFADIAEFDNDPPVTSSLPQPISLTFTSFTTAGGAGAVATVNFTVATGPSDPRTTLPAGSTVTVAPNGTGQETARIIQWRSASQVDIYFQNNHSSMSGLLLTADAATGAPCNLAVAAFDSIFLAGDPNNPHVLYKSKTGRPESFPIQELATGIPMQVNVGSPSDPIVAICEFSGGILCLNKSSINFVRVYQGIMSSPERTPAQRGLLSNGAWCLVDQEVWYLAYDGFYSWSGNVAMKRSQRIEQFFHADGIIPNYVFNGNEVNPTPIDLTRPQYITFAYHNSDILITFVDQSFFPWRFRYSTIYDRWSIDNGVYIVGLEREALTAQYNEPDTGALLVGSSITGLVGGPGSTVAFMTRDDIGSSDHWTTAYTDGQPINWGETSAALTMGAPSLQKAFQDYILELNNDKGSQVGISFTRAQFFYDYSTTPDAIDTITINDPVADGRKRFAFPLQTGWGKEAYAMQVRIFGQGPATLYSQTVNWLPLEQTQSGRAFDWDDLGYPWDKKLRTVTVEYDTGSGYAIPLNLDVMQGIGNAQKITERYQTFSLSAPTGSFTGPSHVKINLPINDGTVVKKVRLRPTVESVLDPSQRKRFKFWPTYLFDFEKYPEDIVLFTPWNNLGWPYEKGIRAIRVEVNSGGVPLQVQLQGDSAVPLATWSVTTTLNDRVRVLTVNNSALVRQARLVFTPGGGGMAQLFDWSSEIVREPPYLNYWSSYEQDFGILGWRWIRKAWIEYYSPTGLLVTFYREGRVFLYSVTLPAHTQRDVECFYLPAGVTAYNKSRLHSVDVIPADNVTPFKVYPGTRLELVPIGADQRQGEVQVPLAEPIQPLGGS